MSFEARSFTFIKRIVQLLKCFMSRSQAGKVIYGLDTVIHLQRIAPTPPNIERAGCCPHLHAETLREQTPPAQGSISGWVRGRNCATTLG
jgi:hypothetical protein